MNPRTVDPVRLMTLDELRHRLTLTVPEAGRALGLGRDASYAAVARGEIPSLTFGRRVVVPVPALLELLGVTSDMSEPGTDIPGTATADRMEPGLEDHHPLRAV